MVTISTDQARFYLNTMKKIFYLTFVLSQGMSCTTGLAQKFSASFGLEYATYEMSDMRDLQREVRDAMPVPAKNIREFPSYWGYNGNLRYSVGRFTFGVNGGLNSTGARTSYSDYSGSVLNDHLAKVVRIGVGADYRLSKNGGPLESLLSLQVEQGLTKYNFYSKMVLDGSTIFEEDLDFVSNHIFVHPAFALKRDITSGLFLAAQFGYLLDLGALLEYSENRDAYLLNSDREAVGVHWSGFRLGLSAGFRF